MSNDVIERAHQCILGIEQLKTTLDGNECKLIADTLASAGLLKLSEGSGDGKMRAGWESDLSAIIGKLSAAALQISPNDDQIIADHVRDSVALLLQFRHKYRATPAPSPIDAAGMRKLIHAAREFVRKVESGEARSKQSYGEFKAALHEIDSATTPAPEIDREKIARLIAETNDPGRWGRSGREERMRRLKEADAILSLIGGRPPASTEKAEGKR